MTNYNEKHNAMYQEAIADLIYTLEQDYSGYYCDLHNEVFNTDYYVIGTYAAEKALEEYGVFDAIRLVQDYEKDNFGEVYTDIADPEKLINMVYYIIGEEVIFEICDIINNDNWNDEADEETNAKIIEALKALQN